MKNHANEKITSYYGYEISMNIDFESGSTGSIITKSKPRLISVYRWKDRKRDMRNLKKLEGSPLDRFRGRLKKYKTK